MDSALYPEVNMLFTFASALVTVLCFVLLGHGQGSTRGGSRLATSGWWMIVALAGGSGLWGAQLIALCGVALPWTQTFHPLPLMLAWGLSVAGTASLLAVSRLGLPPQLRLPVKAGALALLWTLLLMICRDALAVAPLGSAWLPPAPAALALAGALAALLVQRLPRIASRFDQADLRLWLAAGLFGLMTGMAHSLALQDMRFPRQNDLPLPAALSGEVIWLLCGGSLLLLVLGLFAVLADAGSRHRQAVLSASLSEAHRKLREQALADPLTRLPNRQLFEERLAESLAERQRTEEGTLAVVFIDLDGFKPVNDSFGHAAGDAVLAEVGRRLRTLTGTGELAARVGGDEFLLLIGHPAGRERVAQIAQRVLKAIGIPYALPNGVEVNLSCSLGIVLFPEHGPGHKLIANADAAMYAAKRAGGSTYAFYAPSMDQDATLQLELQHDMRTAIEQNQLELYYQPKVHALSGQITGVEALVRWNHPTRGLIMPDAFIPVAERFALIGALGHWVIEEACRQIRAWRDEGLRMRVAVNLSVQQLRQEDLVPRIKRALERYRIEPSLLTFEITESVAMEEVTVRAFQALAGVGASLSIDDFGTAYSNFSSLRKLPAKQLKIDRSLFTDIHDSSDALAVVDAMIKMAHALGLKVVAEGIETEVQRDLLLALNCDEFQGYLYARPMTARMLSLWALDEGETHPVDFRPSLYDTQPALLM